MKLTNNNIADLSIILGVGVTVYYLVPYLISYSASVREEITIGVTLIVIGIIFAIRNKERGVGQSKKWHDSINDLVFGENANENQIDFSDEIYEQIVEEISTDNINQALWLKAETASEGNGAKTKALYTKMRASQIKDFKAKQEQERLKKLEKLKKLESKITSYTSIKICAVLITIACIIIFFVDGVNHPYTWVTLFISFISWMSFSDAIREFKLQKKKLDSETKKEQVQDLNQHEEEQKESKVHTKIERTAEKKPERTLLDDFKDITYGEDAVLTANLDESIKIAYEDLLLKLIPKKELIELANQLYKSSMPYSTNDLAFAVALNFFRRDEYKDILFEAHIPAKEKLLSALKSQSINPHLAQSFEYSLYKIFKEKAYGADHDK